MWIGGDLAAVASLDLDMRATRFLDQTFYNNSMRQWGIALAVALAAFVVLLVIRRLLVGRLGTIAKRTTSQLDDILVEIVARTRPFFLAAAAVVFGSRFLVLPPTTDRYFDAGFALVLLVQCGLWGATAVDLWIHRRAGLRPGSADVASVTTIRIEKMLASRRPLASPAPAITRATSPREIMPMPT